MTKKNTRRARGRRWVRELHGWRLRQTGWFVLPDRYGTWYIGYFTLKVDRRLTAIVDGRGVTRQFVPLMERASRSAAMRVAAQLERQRRLHEKESMYWLAA